jgi:uncharacterized RmlC-like cupin family protein
MAEAQRVCKLVHSSTSKTYDGKQGFTYFEGLSAENAQTEAICMHLLVIPPGGRAHAHMHESHETVIFVVSGEAKVWYGDNLQDFTVTRAGDFFYIPAGVPHLPYNDSSEPCTAVIARTDPNEQESVVLLPELEALPHVQPQKSVSG